ncbi:MAG: hypothetical protein KAT58_13145, partial [candidate division Zixibacteria bacterium]|nr:hypothetical protein [candidate division Zixibacteria bacterium]
MLSTQNLKIQRWGVLWLAMTVLILGCSAGVLAQEDSAAAKRIICIEVPTEVPATSGSPGLVGYRIEWNVACEKNLLPLNTYDSFIVWHSSSTSFPYVERQESKPLTDQGFYVFDNKDSLGQHWFRVLGFLGRSDTVQSKAMNFERSQLVEDKPSWRPGYKFLELLKYVNLIDVGGTVAWQSTSPTGRAAFDLIGIFFLLGIILLIFRTPWIMLPARVFLVNKDIGGHNELEHIMEMDELKNLTQDQRDDIQTLIKKHLTRRFYSGLFLRLVTWMTW